MMEWFLVSLVIFAVFGALAVACNSFPRAPRDDASTPGDETSGEDRHPFYD